MAPERSRRIRHGLHAVVGHPRAPPNASSTGDTRRFGMSAAAACNITSVAVTPAGIWSTGSPAKPGRLAADAILLSLQNRHPLPTTQLSLPRLIQQLAGMTMAHTVTAQTVRNHRHGAATQKVGPTLSRNPTEVQAPTTEPGRLPNNRHFRQFPSAQGQHETYSSNQSFVLIGGRRCACVHGRRYRHTEPPSIPDPGVRRSKAAGLWVTLTPRPPSLCKRLSRAQAVNPGELSTVFLPIHLVPGGRQRLQYSRGRPRKYSNMNSPRHRLQILRTISARFLH
jgi:hypothetical protein